MFDSDPPIAVRSKELLVPVQVQLSLTAKKKNGIVVSFNCFLKCIADLEMFDFVNHTLNRFTMLHDWEYHDPHTGMKDQSLINHILVKSQKLSMSDIAQANPSILIHS